MAKDERKEEAAPRPAAALALEYLRNAAGVPRDWLAARLRHANASLIGKLERGDKAQSRDALAANVAPLGQPPEAADALLAIHPLFVHELADEPVSPLALTRQELAAIDRTCLGAVGGLVGDFRATLIREKMARKAAAARQEAAERWPDLEAASWKQRRRLVATWPRYRTWAMVERACEASVARAAHRADEALELAKFALFIAGRIPDLPRFRSRAEGWCWGFIGNAQRVGEDFDTADRSFAHAWDRWRAGAGSEPDLFPEWRLLSLEASLRREQHRFPEALDRLNRARACCGADKLAAGRILLKKEHVFEQMGDAGGALAILDEAAPLLEELGDPQLLFALRFNRTDNLTRLERYKEGAVLLPGVREMAIEQRDDLSLTRVLWLDAKLRAGLGRKKEAMDLLGQVRDDFTARRHPYDAALSSLDLARLELEAGLTAEVRWLAGGLAWIFESKKIHREALAALALFYEAAMQDTATVELTRQVIADVERVRRSASPEKD